MILGQSAATVAVMAINGEKGIHDVTYETLKSKLIEDGQILTMDYNANKL